MYHRINLKLWRLCSRLGAVLSRDKLGNRVFQRWLYSVWVNQSDFIEKKARAHYPGLLVFQGAFNGLRYPQAEAAGSSLYPKLSGTYESELIDEIDFKRFGDVEFVIDIGCAEGFYAVGLARLFDHITVIAYDIDAAARGLCLEMAALNGVHERLSIRSACLKDDLMAVNGRRAFIFSDCEGYEKELFTAETVKALGCCDCIIEIHEKQGASLAQLVQHFSREHAVTIVESIPDAIKASTINHARLDLEPYCVRLLLMAECRPVKMRWLYAKSKKQSRN